MKRAWLPLLWALVVPAFADDGEAQRAERDRIARERLQVQATFAQQQAECETRFAVTACVDAVRHEQRVALSRLRDQELALDAANRKQRAAERLSVIEEKTRRAPVAGAASAADVTPAATPRVAASAAAAPRPATVVKLRPPRPEPTPRPVAQPKEKPDRSALDAAKRTDFEARQQAAAQRRQAVERRNAERAAKGKAAAGLPVPASAPTR